jgi:hypothetical protein
MIISSRNGAPIDLIVLHDPEGANTARELYNYLQTIQGGYHSLDDDMEEIICAADDQIVWGAGGVNERSLHICFVPGQAAWSRSQWLVHTAAIQRGAHRAAIWGALHGIPMRFLTPAQVGTVGTKGICTHGDVTAAGYTASMGHTDPGPNFPKDVFLAAATGIIPPSNQEYEDMLIAAPAWQTHDPNRPASVRLDLAGKRLLLMNGARIAQPNASIPTSAAVLGWYETFTSNGSKEGFTVMAAKDASGNPAFHYTWPKKP